MNWLLIALVGAITTSLTTILAKVGIKDVDSDWATFYRTGIVVAFALLMCLISGSIKNFPTLSATNYVFLILSGLATGISWLCYYKALKLGDVSKVTPIDKSSFILTSILFLIFFFSDTTKGGDPLTIVMLVLSIALIGSGTIIMAVGNPSKKKGNHKWLFYAIMSAVSSSFVSLFVKIGLKGMPSDLGTFIRTIIVLIFSLAIVLSKKKYKGIGSINGKSWLFLTLSGVMTGVAWLAEYYALNMDGVSPVAVSSIGKLSILITMLFSFVFLKEKLTLRKGLGLSLLAVGVVLVTVFSL